RHTTINCYLTLSSRLPLHSPTHPDKHFFFFSSRRRHTRFSRDWSSDVCSSDLPSTCFAEDEGATVNSGRWLQWHWPGVTPPGDAQTDNWIMANLFLRIRELYRTEGGKVPEPILNLTWEYADPAHPHPAELAKELNGRALQDLA